MPSETSDPNKTSDVVVLLAADSPERVAALLSSPALGSVAVTVCPYGEHAEAVARVAVALGAGTSGLTADRWSAFAHGWAAVPLVDVLLLSQEAILARDWLAAARGAMSPSAIAVADGKASCDRMAPARVVAPVSEQASTADQRIALSAEDVELGIEAYAHNRRTVFGAIVSQLTVPAPLALFVAGVSRRALNPVAAHGAWMFAGIVAAAAREGLVAVVAEGWYVGSSAVFPGRPEVTGCLRDRVAFYGPGPSEAPVLWGLLRLGFRTLRDLALARATLGRLGPSVDGIAVVVVSNPLEVQTDPAWTAARDKVDARDRELLRACSGADASGVGTAVRAWVAELSRAPRVVSAVWTAEPNEAKERSAVIGLARVAEPGADRERRLWGLRLDPGELVEQTGTAPESTREFLRRICRHPSPTVLAYDVALQTLWDGPQSIREDAPWGDGGSWRGGPSAVRLYRLGAGVEVPVRDDGGPALADPVFSPESTRIANLRIFDARLIRSVDRDAVLGLRRVEEGVRLARASTTNRIGLHMLVYERENPEDVARWLDEMHGLLDAAVLVWTGAAVDEVSGLPTERAAFVDVADRYGALMIDHPLNDDLAGARNAGIAEVAARACSWALFFDPDEWLLDPRSDAIALRRMAESARAGWLVQVANYTESGQPTISDSIRMSSTRPEMRMTGRVHEGFGDGIKAIQARGEHPRLVYARFVLQHRGMNLGAARTAEKLARYDALLRQELAEHPDNAGAWVSLAWHLDNDGHRDLAEEALQRAALCAGTAYLPFREIAVQRLREARVALESCVERLSADHQYAKHANEMLRWLRQHAPDAIPMPSHRAPPEPLPAFPGRGPESSPAAFRVRIPGAGYDPGEEKP